MLSEGSDTHLGAGGREFKSRHSDQSRQVFVNPVDFSLFSWYVGVEKERFKEITFLINQLNINRSVYVRSKDIFFG